MIDWRSLFDALHVEWRDRGPNSSRNNITIKCPFCHDDPSTHLAVAYDGAGYYCFRNPTHRGVSAPRLLVRLGASYDEAQRLLRHYSDSSTASPAKARVPSFSQLQTVWSHFDPVSQSDRYIDYLTWRGFEDADLVADYYDLRYARVGKWSGRLLIPYYENGSLISWVGRSITNHDPKYLAQISDEGVLYVPGRARARYDTGVLVEGPLDALKIAAACRTQGIMAAALSGKALPASKLLRISRFLDCCSGRYLALDADVPMSQIMAAICTIACALKSRYIRRLPIPRGHKDPGELSYLEVRTWLTGMKSGRG
jgi:hypothetical protein